MGERGEVAEGVVHYAVEVVRAHQPEEGRLEGRLRDGLRRVGLGLRSPGATSLRRFG